MVSEVKRMEEEDEDGSGEVTDKMTNGKKQVEGHSTRARCLFEDLSGPYKQTARTFGLQYYPYYNARLSRMYESVKEHAQAKWGSDLKVVKLSDLPDSEGQRVCIIGCLLKRMELQPTILKEVSEDHQLIPQPTRRRYTSEEDTLLLQDERDSIGLIGNIDIDGHVTGVTLAVVGHETEEGSRFLVEDFCYPTLRPQKPMPSLAQDKYVAIVSGLGFARKMDPKLIDARELFVNFVTGSQGEEDSQKAALVVRVIVAGNSIGKRAREQESEDQLAADVNAFSWNKKTRPFTIEAVKMLDDFLVELGKTLSVDLMPGALDPTSLLLPQQPLHHCILPKSSLLDSVRCVTNPYAASFDGITLLGSSGRSVRSISEYSRFEEPVDILEKTLEWGHLAPTAPDTLHSYPFLDKDPFVLTECPHVYFVGNQEKFNTKLYQGPGGQRVRLVAVPDFEADANCVLVNLRTLDCELVAFN